MITGAKSSWASTSDRPARSGRAAAGKRILIVVKERDGQTRCRTERRKCEASIKKGCLVGLSCRQAKRRVSSLFDNVLTVTGDMGLSSDRTGKHNGLPCPRETTRYGNLQYLLKQIGEPRERDV